MTTNLAPDEAPGSDPLSVFLEWIAEAQRREATLPDAFALATATRDGRPAVRYVLYKGIIDGSLRFVSNYQSRKGLEIEENPRGALVFYWPVLDRQVRMEGRIERAPEADSDRYFADRDRQSQLGAWASAQSRPVPARGDLLLALDHARARFEGKPVERPPHWGMYAFVPDCVELWISGAHRLHDRFLYRLGESGWTCSRLAP